MLQDPELGIEVRDTLSKNLCDVRSSERSVTADRENMESYQNNDVC